MRGESVEESETSPTFFKILLIVTGEGEELFLPQFLRSLYETGRCCFTNPRRVGQLTPRSESRRLKMVDGGKPLTNRQQELGLIARRFLQSDASHLVLLVDDLENRAESHREVFALYRSAFDTMLAVDLQQRAGVHFLVRMVEAYYFAHNEVVNDVLGLDLEDITADPESIRHPKGMLKQLCRERGMSFDEKTDGQKIAERIDLPRVLSNPETCRSIRCLVKWCFDRTGAEMGDRFQLKSGHICRVAGVQLRE